MYAGPIYYMHYKYSSIMTLVFITFIYGFGMPILFPVAFLSCLVLYLCEKVMLFYAYRLPPMYDEMLSQDVLNKLQFAPVLYLAFGYWMASNQQLISNGHLEPMVNANDVPITSHTYGSILNIDGWTGLKWPMLLSFFVLTLIYIFGEWLELAFESCITCIWKDANITIGDIDLNEDIDTYFAALDNQDRNWSQKEEENSRTLKTSQIMTDEQFELLNNTPITHGKTLQGVHSYDILANPLYLDDFQYVSAAEENRDKLIIDDDDQEGNDCAQSDVVRLILNMAYLQEREVKSFDFSIKGLRDS